MKRKKQFEKYIKENLNEINVQDNKGNTILMKMIESTIEELDEFKE